MGRDGTGRGARPAAPGRSPAAPRPPVPVRRAHRDLLAAVPGLEPQGPDPVTGRAGGAGRADLVRVGDYWPVRAPQLDAVAKP